MEHAKLGLGGSVAGRTIACPSWRTLAQQVPPRPSSDAADEGTMLHDVIEHVLRGMPAVIGSKHDNGKVLTRDLYDDKVLPAFEALQRLIAEEFEDFEGPMEAVANEDILLEQTVELGGIPGAFGTVDVLIDHPDCLVILDWKFGDGVMVSPEQNDQLSFYACGAIDTLFEPNVFEDDDLVMLAIIQPARGVEEPLKTWKTTVAELRGWKEKYRLAVESTGYQLGKHCRFCPADIICPAQGNAEESLMRLPVELSPAELAEALNYAMRIEDRIKSLRQLGHDFLESGQDLPGWKLVRKQARRVWDADEEKLKKFLQNRGMKVPQIYEHKLRSPAQIEKAFTKLGRDKKVLDQFIKTPDTGLVLAAHDDKRPAAISPLALAAKRLQSKT